LFLLILNIFVSVWYVIDKDAGCGPSTDPVYSLFYTIYNIILSLVPLFTLFIFSVLTLFDIWSASHHRISPMIQTPLNHNISQQTQRYRKKDIQFMKWSLIQVADYIIFTTRHGYNTIYGVIAQNKIKTADQTAVHGFMYGMGLNLHYTYRGINFFFLYLSIKTIILFR